MAEITRKRTGELVRIVVELLLEKPEGMPAQEILDHIPRAIELTEYEKGYYASSPNDPRYEKIVRFATVDMVKAGWLVKSKGQWILTEEG
jgi:restriction system protein